jgi:hypothetical protein
MSTENANSRVVIVAQMISLVLTFVLVFLGSNYAFNSWLISFVASIFSVFLIYVLIDHFIKQKQILNRKGYSKKTYLFLLTYAVLILPTSLFTIHALNVEFFEKTVAIDNSLKKIKYIQDFESYYTSEYKSFIQENEASIIQLVADGRKYHELNKNSDLAQVKSALQAPPLNLTPGAIDRLITIQDASQVSGIIHGISSQNDTLFNQAKIRIQGNFMSSEDMDLKIRKWNRFNVLSVIDKLDKRLKDERDSLNVELKKSTDSYRSMDAFKKFAIQEDLVGNPIDLLASRQEPMVYLFVIVFQCLLLLPYWLTKKPRYNSASGPNNGGGGISIDL